MPRQKRPLAEADANSAPPAKRVSTGPTASGQENVVPDYSKKSIAELKTLLRDRALPLTGKKQDLVQRLANTDTSTTTSRSRSTATNAKSSSTATSARLDFRCFCRPFDDVLNQKREEEDDFDSDDEFDPKELEDHGTKKCMCDKPAKDFPDFKWCMSKDGEKATEKLSKECDNRDEAFNGEIMITDFSSYGFQEAIENHLVAVDKELRKADPSPTVLWPLIEALAFSVPGNEGTWFLGDNGDEILETLQILGGAVICTLDVLEKHDLLKPNSAIRNIALVLGMLRQIIEAWPGDNDDHGLSWNDAIVHKAMKHGIEFRGAPHGIDKVNEVVNACDDEKKYDKDIEWSKFSWKPSFARFKRDHSRGDKLGGNYWDLSKPSVKNRRRSGRWW